MSTSSKAPTEPRRGRKITDDPAGVKPKGSVKFIKNQTNERVVLPDGETFVFPQSSFTTNDPDLIKGLRAVAKKYNILEK